MFRTRFARTRRTSPMRTNRFEVAYAPAEEAGAPPSRSYRPAPNDWAYLSGSQGGQGPGRDPSPDPDTPARVGARHHRGGPVRKVYKYQFPMSDEIELVLPYRAELLYFDSQDDVPTLWARVVPDGPKEIRRFRLRGTGHEGAEGAYVGTALFKGGVLVFHLFEVITDKTEWVEENEL